LCFLKIPDAESGIGSDKLGHMWAGERCRISPPCFLAERCKKRLNQSSFVLLCLRCVLFSGLCLVSELSVFNLSSVMYFPVCINVNGTVYIAELC